MKMQQLRKLTRLLCLSVLAALALAVVAPYGSAALSAGEKVIGMIVRDIEVPFEQALINGVKKGCKEFGYKLDAQDGKGDTLQILDHIDTFIMQEIDGFIMAGATDQKGIIPGIEKLNRAGIPVMALDSCPEGGKVDMFITFNNTTQTEKATKIFIEGIKARNNGEVPKGVVIAITGDLMDMVTGLLTKGFNNVISQYPQLTVAEGEGKWNNDDSYLRTAELLTRYGDEVLGVYVQTPDIMGQGAVRAIETAGLDPRNYGVSGIHIGPEFMDYIRDGKVLACVAFCGYDYGYLATKYLNDSINGVPLPKVGDVIEEEGALWSPAKVLDIKEVAPDAVGLYLDVNGPLVPTEVSPDDPRLWENMIDQW